MKSFTLVIALFVALIVLVSNTQGQMYVTDKFTLAVDAAVKNLVKDVSFQQMMLNLTYTPVPVCSDDIDYPATNPIPANLTTWNMCYQEADSISYPWGYIYEAVGNGIVKNINAKYNLKLGVKFVSLNTSSGFFESLKAAVDSGICHVAVADVTPSEDRTPKVHFQGCSYGAVSDAYLRGPLAANLTINRHTDLNKTGIIVSVYQGTTHEEFARANFQAATIYAVSYDEQFLMVAQSRAHAMIGNLLDVNSWLANHPGSCATCTVKTYGAPSAFGTFTTGYIIAGGSILTINWMMIALTLLASLITYIL